MYRLSQTESSNFIWYDTHDQDQDIFQKMIIKKYFSKLNLTKRQRSSHPTARRSFFKMQFGLVNSGATLVKGLRKVLGNLENIVNYGDDIVLHAQTWEEHMDTLKILFQRLFDASSSSGGPGSRDRIHNLPPHLAVRHCHREVFFFHACIPRGGIWVCEASVTDMATRPPQ